MGVQSRPAGTASLVRSAPIGCGLCVPTERGVDVTFSPSERGVDVTFSPSERGVGKRSVPTFLFYREGNPREKVGV